MAPPDPLYIPVGSTAAFAVYHPPPEGEGAPPRRRPVLFCPPWGWNEVASHRTRREWAERLAAAGSPTLRFDLPATGNSGGSPADGGIVARWVAAIAAAASWLAHAHGEGNPIDAVGFGLGGLLALAAVAAGAPIAALALWATPPNGRRFIRELGAFSRMQAWYGSDQEDFDPGVPEGWLEAGGFVLSPETLAELRELTPELEEAGTLRRVLAFGRDGIPFDEKALAGLRELGIEVSERESSGWGTFVSHPEHSRLPHQIAEELDAWLELDPPAAARAPNGDAVAAREELDLGACRETALVVEQDWGRTLGILTEPRGQTSGDLCAIFLNAGAVRLSGPNRLWVETARRWAGTHGVASLRLDLQGIGEADGEGPGDLRVGDFYQPRYLDQVAAVIDELERRGHGPRFLLVGLCAGAYWAFRQSVADPRVVASIELNAGALRWDDDLVLQREARKGSRLFERHWWRKLVRGEISSVRLRRLLRSLLANSTRAASDLLKRLVGRSRRRDLGAEIEADLDALRERGTGTLIAFSGDEPLGAEVAEMGLAERASRWPNLELATLPGSDHTLRPLSAQRAAAALLDAELERVRDAAA